MFAALSELSCQVLCLAFKSKLLRQAIALVTQLSLLQTSKSKNTALRAKKSLHAVINDKLYDRLMSITC